MTSGAGWPPARSDGRPECALQNGSSRLGVEQTFVPQTASGHRRPREHGRRLHQIPSKLQSRLSSDLADFGPPPCDPPFDLLSAPIGAGPPSDFGPHPVEVGSTSGRSCAVGYGGTAWRVAYAVPTPGCSTGAAPIPVFPGSRIEHDMLYPAASRRRNTAWRQRGVLHLAARPRRSMLCCVPVGR